MTDILTLAVEAFEHRMTGPGYPYELQSECIGERVYATYKQAPRSLVELYRRALKMGDAPLAVAHGRRMSYRDTFARVAYISAALRANFAISPEERIAIAVENPLEWISVFLSVTGLGATAVLVSTERLSIVTQALRISRCAVVIAEGSVGRAMRPDSDGALTAFAVTSNGDEVIAAGALVRLAEAGDGSVAIEPGSGFASPEPESDALIAFTSGTTGTPKGVVVSHRAVLTGLMNMALGGLLASVPNANATLRPQPVRTAPSTLVLNPLSYIGGYSQLLLALTIGGKLVICPGWDCERVRGLMDSERVRSLVGGTASQIRQLLAARPDAGLLSSVGVYGSALHGGLLDEIADRWPDVTVSSGYGMTEAGGTVAATSGESLRRQPRCAGRVVPTLEVRIVHPNGTDAERGETGEIWIRGASVMRGYCTTAGKPQGLLDGWLRTGDLGSLSSSRYLSVLARFDERLQSAQDSTFAYDVEGVVLADPAITEAAVVKTPDFPAGLHVVVVPREAFAVDGRVVERQIAVAFPALADQVRVVTMSTIPKTRSGKVDQAALHRLLQGYQDELRSVAVTNE